MYAQRTEFLSMITVPHKRHPKNTLVASQTLHDGVSFLAEELYQLQKILPTASQGKVRSYTGIFHIDIVHKLLLY